MHTVCKSDKLCGSDVNCEGVGMLAGAEESMVVGWGPWEERPPRRSHPRMDGGVLLLPGRSECRWREQPVPRP